MLFTCMAKLHTHMMVTLEALRQLTVHSLDLSENYGVWHIKHHTGLGQQTFND